MSPDSFLHERSDFKGPCRKELGGEIFKDSSTLLLAVFIPKSRLVIFVLRKKGNSLLFKEHSAFS